MFNATNVNRRTRMSSYALAALVAPLSAADELYNTLDESFNLSYGEEGVLRFAGLTVFEDGSPLGSFSMGFNISWNDSGRLNLSALGAPWTAMIRTAIKADSDADIYTYGMGHEIMQNYTDGGDVDRQTVETGILDLPSELGVFYIGFELTHKSSSWFGFVAIDLVSRSDLKIDHWGLQTEENQSITTRLPSTGDPVPGIGGIAGLALGACGVRRSRRRLV